jgi:hypothetical protein
MSPLDGAAEVRRLIVGAEEVNWPDPEPLFEPSEAERPYPLDALPTIIARAIDEYRGYGQQPLPLIACSAMSSTSLATQGLVDIARDVHLVGPISSHSGLVAISGERKTSADRAFNRPLREWAARRQGSLQPDADRAHAELAAWTAEREGLLLKIKRDAGRAGTDAEADRNKIVQRLADLESSRPKQVIVPSLFYEDTNAARLAVDIAEGWPSSSIWSDEAGLVVGSHGMNDDNLMGFIGLLNRLWDGHDFDRSRLTVKSAHIKGRRLTVSLMMQPVVLKRLLGAGDGASRGMGWIARTLLAWPASTIGARPYRNVPDMPALDALHRRLRELLDMKLPIEERAGMVLAPPALCMSPSAFQVWRSLHDDVEAELSRVGEFASIPDIGAKIAENAARIAGQFHVITQGPGGSVDAATMKGAAAVAIWHLNEARRILGATKTPQDVADADLLLEWLLRQPQDAIEPREILRLGPLALRDKGRRDAAIKVLIEKHWIFEVKDGRTTRFVLNPKAKGTR